MKNLIALSLITLLSVSTSFAQHGMGKGNANRNSPHDTVKSKNITITYGRPYKKGRDIFGGLEAYGKVWRLGADEATQITFNKDCTFGGKAVKKGTYTMFATPGQSEWTIILNSKLGQWGAFSYDNVKDKDVLSANVPVNHTNAVTEQLTISLPDGGMLIQWDRTSVMVPIKF